MSGAWTVARRDAKALFDQPTGYVLLVVFLAINAFLFFRSAYLSNLASLRPMMDFLPWMFLFFVPAVAMRSLAEDHRSGLLEIVLAQPVSEVELLLGKYLGVLVVLLGALALTLPIPIGLLLGSHLPLGPVVAQYVGAALLAAAFAGVGVWASGLGKSQITAFIMAVAVMFLLILVGLDPLLVGLPPALGAVAARLGVLSHFGSVGRGVLDLRDVLYFLSVAAVFLALAYAVLMRRRLTPGSRRTELLRWGTLLVCAVVVALDLAGGAIGGRLDLTPGRAYTLSPETKAIARGLPDIVTIRVFASTGLPAQFALNQRDVNDLLHDLRGASRGKIRVIEQDPAASPAAASQAQSLGIEPVQFNVVGQSELQVKDGYFGLAVEYAAKHETIPFILRTNDLEYRLASALRDLTRAAKPTVALVADSAAGSTSLLRQQLGRSYEVGTPIFRDSSALAGISVLVLASGAAAVPPAESAAVARYLAGGGAALILTNGASITPRLPLAEGRKVPWNGLLAPYGVQVGQDVVYDLRAAQIVGVPTRFGQVLRPYPYFVRGQSTKASPINADLAEMDLAWPSSVDTTASSTSVAVPLIVTTPAAGAATGEVTLDPSQTFSTANLRRRVLALQVAPRPGRHGSRLVVVGDPSAASDDFVQRSPENLTFALNAVDWLAQDEGLIAIRAKDRTPPPLLFASVGTRGAVKYGNVGVVPLLVAAFGLVHLLKRRRLAAKAYRPLREAA